MPGVVNRVASGRWPPSRKLWHIAGSKWQCWLWEKKTKCSWQEASTLRQRQQNSAFNCTQWNTVAYVTNNERLYLTFCTVEANYWQIRSIARPLCDSRATCFISVWKSTVDYKKILAISFQYTVIKYNSRNYHHNNMDNCHMHHRHNEIIINLTWSYDASTTARVCNGLARPSLQTTPRHVDQTVKTIVSAVWRHTKKHELYLGNYCYIHALTICYKI